MKKEMKVSMKDFETEEGKKIVSLIRAFLEGRVRKAIIEFEGLEVKGSELSRLLDELTRMGFRIKARGDMLLPEEIIIDDGSDVTEIVIEIGIRDGHIDDESRPVYLISEVRMRKRYF